jgi:hypothetical protein
MVDHESLTKLVHALDQACIDELESTLLGGHEVSAKCRQQIRRLVVLPRQSASDAAATADGSMAPEQPQRPASYALQHHPMVDAHTAQMFGATELMCAKVILMLFAAFVGGLYLLRARTKRPVSVSTAAQRIKRRRKQA